MERKPVLIGVWLLVAGSEGCGLKSPSSGKQEDGPAPIRGGCQQGNDSCVDYLGEFPDAFIAVKKKACEANQSNTWFDTGCSSADILGGCRQGIGKDVTITWYYRSPDHGSVEQIRALCRAANDFFVEYSRGPDGKGSKKIKILKFQQKKVSNPVSSFGRHVRIDGGRLLVSSSEAEGGAVYIYEESGQDWSLVKRLASTDNETDFGWAHDVSGVIAVVTAGIDEGNKGIVRVYDGSASWSEVASIGAAHGELGDAFGRDVSILGDRILVGAPGEDGNRVSGTADNSIKGAGAAYVFKKDGSQWKETDYLKADLPFTDDGFGSSVDLSDTRAVVGAPGADCASTKTNNGAVYVFKTSSSGMQLEQCLSAESGDPGDRFGASVRIFGERIVVGAPHESGNGSLAADDSSPEAGAAYLFAFRDDKWQQIAYLKGNQPDLLSHFGVSVALGGQTVIVGQNYAVATANDAKFGSVFLFEELGDTWSIHAKQVGDQTPASSSGDFGSSVDFAYPYIIIGAPTEKVPSVYVIDRSSPLTESN